MKNIKIEQMQFITAGDTVDAFCAGFGAGTLIYVGGVAANFWNPVGWAGGLTLTAITAGCAAYALR
jgi:hypothetical protein